MLFWQRPDLIRQLLPNVDFDEVQRIRQGSQEALSLPNWVDLPDFFEQLPTIEELQTPVRCDLKRSAVCIGQRTDVSAEQLASIEEAIKRLHPWRKGPFDLFGIEIDAEWRSNLKWERIESALGDLKHRRILDIGCGNGYYMFRAAAQEPDVVLGMDPSVPFFYAFELMQRYAQLANLQYERMGFEHLYVFDQAFDIGLCMGVLYHHRSPIEILRDLLKTLRVGGFAIIESQSIDGDGSMALFPENRYAKARNMFFVPTKECLVNWVKRAGFKDVEIVSHTKVTTDEQRSTEFMTYESLKDFLHPEDDRLTIEGYPAPCRTVVKAVRKFL